MLGNLREVRQQTRNNEIHWLSCQRGTHPFLESFAALNWEPNYGLQITSPPHPLREEKKPKHTSLSLSLKKELNEPGNHRLPSLRWKRYCTSVTQADYTKGSKWWLFFHAIQLHGILHLQLLPASVMACNRLSLTYLLPIIHLHRNWGQPAGELAQWQDVSCSPVDIIHSCDGNLDPFYKELWWEGNCFSSHATWKI